MSIWQGDTAHRFAPALATLLHQLQGAYPGSQWQKSPQTGTIGDAAHFAEGSASDHNPWLANTVRALDVAANVTGVPGIQNVTDAPDCEALFRMINQMYADRDPRVFPDGYAIFRGRVTSWGAPGQFGIQIGDPHRNHIHISTSRNAAGFNSTAPWPLPTQNGSHMTLTPDDLSAIGAELRAELAAAGIVERTAVRVSQYEDGTNRRVVELDQIAHQLLTMEAQQTAQNVADAVVAKLPAGQTFTAADVASALFDQFRAAVADAQPPAPGAVAQLAETAVHDQAGDVAAAAPPGVAHAVSPAAA